MSILVTPEAVSTGLPKDRKLPGDFSIERRIA